ncbi:MAG: PAS domain-containing sensor histidine kinase [Gemmatimonadales bacterium]
MTLRSHVPGVRTRFLLVVLLGVLIPLALLGAWIAYSGQRSAEQMLREQLETALAGTATDVGHRWIEMRGRLLDLGEHPAVLAALRAGRDPLGTSAAPELREMWSALHESTHAVEFTGPDGAALTRLGREVAAVPIAGGYGSMRVRLPLFDSTGERVGSMDVQLRLAALLPAAYLSAGLDRISAVLNEAGAPLSPLNMDPALLMRPGFQWAGEPWMAAHRQIREPALVLALAAPTAPASLPFAEAARRGTWALLLVSGCGFLLALLLTWRITTPLERLADAADSVARGELDRRVEEHGPSEIRRLGVAFNTMTRSLQRTLRRVSQQEAAAAIGSFAASLAHEVRNPLSAVRLDLERAREEVPGDDRVATLLDRALQQIERLDATVSGSLRIARSGNVPLTPLDVRDTISAAVAAARPHFAERGARLDQSISAEALMVHGNSAALEQLLLNLLLNAAAALPAQGRAAVEARLLDDAVEITVRDDGCGIPSDQLDQIFDPFYTTREEGTGLGLTIVRRIADAHGADLSLESQPGLGTTIRLSMPHTVTIHAAAGTIRNAPDRHAPA